MVDSPPLHVHLYLWSIESATSFKAITTSSKGITELNPALEARPELVNTDPYGEGWMIKMTVANTDDVAKLMTVQAYTSLVG